MAIVIVIVGTVVSRECQCYNGVDLLGKSRMHYCAKMTRHVAIAVIVLFTMLANGAPRPSIYADDKVVSDF